MALRDLLPELKELPLADGAEFESIAGICGIGLSATCFCQAYREAFARGEAGVSGVDEEAQGVKVVVQATLIVLPGAARVVESGEL